MSQVLHTVIGNGVTSRNHPGSKPEVHVFMDGRSSKLRGDLKSADSTSSSYLLHIPPTRPIGMGAQAKCEGLSDST